MPNSPIDAHADELNAAYAWARRFEDPADRRHAAAVLDILLRERIAVPADLPTDASIGCLLRAMKQAAPNRDTIVAVATGFGGWWRQIGANARAMFLEQFPRLAPAVADLGADGMKQVVESVNRDPRLLVSIAHFAPTTRAIIRSVVRVATTQPVAEMQRLVAAFPMALIEEDRQAEKALALLGDAPHALALVLDIAEKNASSAAGLIPRLPKTPVDPDYLRLFCSAVKAAGTQAIGWCLSELPKLLERLGAARLQTLMEGVTTTSEQYGELAAMALLERRTKAARDYWQ